MIFILELVYSVILMVLLNNKSHFLSIWYLEVNFAKWLKEPYKLLVLLYSAFCLIDQGSRMLSFLILKFFVFDFFFLSNYIYILQPRVSHFFFVVFGLYFQISPHTYTHNVNNVDYFKSSIFYNINSPLIIPP